MKNEIFCEHCDGTGKIEINYCVDCKKETETGEYKGRQICPDCWAKTLTDQEIQEL